VVVVHDEGRTNFSELQAELAAGRQDRLIYYAFDILWRDGDLRKLPQIDRKQKLLDRSVKTASTLRWFTANISSATGRRCFGMPPS